MLLKNLISISSTDLKSIKINNLALDSRKVKKGDLFFAIKGAKKDGNKFIGQAIKRGAKAIICSKDIKSDKINIPIIKVKNVRSVLAKACKIFFQKKPKNIIAVTGTNGKTSVSDFYFQILSLNKVPVASIGTLGIKKNKNIKKINLTSPDIITMHKELENLKKNKINNVIIEASSHGLEQYRLHGIKFKAGIFTNFSQDHLDYHGDMKNYLKSKLILFEKLMEKNKYLITDPSLKIFEKLKKIAIKKNIKILTINNNKLFFSPNLIGTFQSKNLSMAVLASNICGLSISKINSKLNNIKSVNGRLQILRTLENKTKVFIDYAHTPEALYTALSSLKEKFKKNLTLVFGCGGERDFKKRPIMAKIANRICNRIYVTDDNPRTENAKLIRKNIIKYLDKAKYLEVGKRNNAIKLAIENSEPNEIILIAGKGHENYQDYGKKIIKISDREIVKKVKFKKYFSDKKINFFQNAKILKKILKNKKNYEFQGVSIDSKNLKKNNLFIAIKGKHKDGHNFLKEAINNGAKFCAVSSLVKNINKKKLIKVKNTYNLLEKIGSKKREDLNAKIIAVTGSSGKTTVKTMLGNLLNNFSNTYYSPKSFNNHYGVPLSLSNLESNHEYGVIEIGMNKPGEINKLSSLVKPDIAIITNIAEAHIENFKNLSGIAQAKSEIINNIKKNGTLILNYDDKFYNYLKNLAKIKKIKTITFGKTNKADIFPIYTRKNNYIKIKVVDQNILIKKNKINIYNILTILAVIKLLNLDMNKIKKSINSLSPEEGRGKLHKIRRFKKKFNLIDESYNANPLSMKNAIINLSNIKTYKSKKYLLLGDMLELGKESNIYHKRLSKVINNADIDKVFIYGNKIFNTYKTINKNKKGNILNSLKDFDSVFSSVIKKNDYLMIKGSNATGLNRLSKKIIKGAINVI